MSEMAAPDYARLGPATGKRIVVTGGCGGIGRRLVKEASALGVEIAVLDLPASLERHGVPDGVAAIPYDALDDDSCAAAFAEVANLWNGEADGFVHLPGFMNDKAKVIDLPMDAIDETLAVNLRSAFSAVKGAVPLLKKAGGGPMVFAASGLATLVEQGTGTYSAAKAGIIALAKGLAKEHAADGIRANCIAPGAVDTEFLRGGTSRGGEESNEEAFPADMDKAKMLATIPMGRIAVVEDVIGPILFLLGDASRFMTGQTLYINGGRLMV